MMLNAIKWINSEPWRRVPTAGLVFSFLFAGVVLYFTFFGSGWVPLVDAENGVRLDLLY